MSIEATPEFELVVPCYNEKQNLPTLIGKAVAAATAAGYGADKFQLIVVQNGSSDGSGERLAELSHSDLGPWFRTVEIAQNQGYGFGVYAGLQATRAPFIGWTHADLQTDPADAFVALAIAQHEGPDTIVKGVRTERDWKERCVSRSFEALGHLILGLTTYELNAQPKVFARAVLQLLENPPKDFAFDLYFLYCAQKAGLRVKEINVRFPPRVHGLSNWASSYASRYRTMGNMVGYMFKLLKSEGRV